jgi:hypothetical protein
MRGVTLVSPSLAISQTRCYTCVTTSGGDERPDEARRRQPFPRARAQRRRFS